MSRQTTIWLTAAWIAVVLSCLPRLAFAATPGPCVPNGDAATALEKANKELAAGEIAAASKTLDDALKNAKATDLSMLRLRLARLGVLWHIDPDAYPAKEAPGILARTAACDAETRAHAAAENIRLAFVKLRPKKDLSKKDVEPVLKNVEKLRKGKEPPPASALGVALTLAGRLAFHAGMKPEGLQLGLDAVEQWEKEAPAGHYLRWHAAGCALMSMGETPIEKYNSSVAKRLASSAPAWPATTRPDGVSSEMIYLLRQLSFLKAMFADELETSRTFILPIVRDYRLAMPPPTPYASHICNGEVVLRTFRDGFGSPHGYEAKSFGTRACEELQARVNIKMAKEERRFLDGFTPTSDGGKEIARLLGALMESAWDMAALSLAQLANMGTESPDLSTLRDIDQVVREIATDLPEDRQRIALGELLLSSSVAATTSIKDCALAAQYRGAFDVQSKDFFQSLSRSETFAEFDQLVREQMENASWAYQFACGSMPRFVLEFTTVARRDGISDASTQGSNQATKRSQLKILAQEIFLQEDPRKRKAPPGTELMQLADVARWGGLLVGTGASPDVGRDAMLWVMRSDRFGELGHFERGQICEQYPFFPPPTRAATDTEVHRRRCKRFLETPREWRLLSKRAIRAAVATSDDVVGLTLQIAAISGRAAVETGNVTSITTASKSAAVTRFMKPLILGLQRKPGSFADPVPGALGTIALQLGGIEDDLIRSVLLSKRSGGKGADLPPSSNPRTLEIDKEFVLAFRRNDKARMSALADERHNVQLQHFAKVSVSEWLRLPPSATFADLCRRDSHVVLYFETDDELHSIILPPDCSARYQSLGGLDSIESLIQDFARLREDDARWPGLSKKEVVLARALELRRKLWTPLGIPTGGTVAVADSRLTSRVVLAAIAGQRMNTFLAEDHVLIRGYALRDFWPQAARKAAASGAISVLGAVQPADRADAAATEKAFQTAFPTANVLTGESATMANVMKALGGSGARYLSFTAHGQYVANAASTDEAPMRESLWTQTEIELGGKPATALELLSLPMDKTELVFLGACESGTGPEGADGVTTLRRALRLAGAQSVVSSIGLVNRRAARRAAALFWEEIVAGKPPAAALAASQRRRLGELREVGGLWYSPPQWALFEISTALPPR